MRRRNRARASSKLGLAGLGAILVLGACAPGSTVLPDDRTPSGAAARTALSAAEGHRRMAAALGRVATRCWVGAGFDGEEIVGSYRPRVQDGWYSGVEEAREGRRAVEVRDGATWRTLFVVSWASDRVAAEVPCRVHAAEGPAAETTPAAEDLQGPGMGLDEERAILEALARDLDGDAAAGVEARLRSLDRQANLALLAREAERAVDALRAAEGKVEVDAALDDVLDATGALLDHAQAVSP